MKLFFKLKEPTDAEVLPFFGYSGAFFQCFGLFAYFSRLKDIVMREMARG